MNTRWMMILLLVFLLILAGCGGPQITLDLQRAPFAFTLVLNVQGEGMFGRAIALPRPGNERMHFALAHHIELRLEAPRASGR